MRMRSEGLVVETATMADLPELEELYSETCGYFKFDKPTSCCTPTEMLSGAKYPKQGVPENFELLTIRLNEMLIGYAMVYRDFPSKEYVDLLTLYIGEPARGKGFGTQSAKLINRYFYTSGYASMRVVTSLRNWGALRFWYRLGFNGIINLDAPCDFDDGGNGYIELEKHFVQMV